MTHLEPVGPLPPPPEGFDVETMKRVAEDTSAAALRAYGLTLTAENGQGLSHLEQIADYADQAVQAEAGALIELNNHYEALGGKYVEVFCESEVVRNEINGVERFVLEHRNHPTKGDFGGFTTLENWGVCVVLSRDKQRYFPLRDVEDICESSPLLG